MIKFFLSALWSGFLALIGLQKKDSIQDVAEHDATVAEKQAAIVADRSRPDAADRLSNGTF